MAFDKIHVSFAQLRSAAFTKYDKTDKWLDGLVSDDKSVFKVGAALCKLIRSCCSCCHKYVVVVVINML